MRYLALRSLACVLAWLLASCALDFGAGTGVPCTAASQCREGATCHRGFCAIADGDLCTGEGTELDCYSGPPATVGVGICRPGVRTCHEGAYSACRSEIVPGLEVCNGDDDDCDGRIDDVASAQSCATGAAGACGAGTLTCVGMSATCTTSVVATDETCDGTDEDCDARTDEQTGSSCYATGASGCTRAADGSYTCVGVCTAGRITCTGGELSGCEGSVTPTTLDGCTPAGSPAQDDDCDGTADEDCPCTAGSTQTCYDGTAGTVGIGPCRAGVQTCVASGGTTHFGACVGMRAPSAETCANTGVDDDCNSAMDDVAGVGDSCVAGAGVGGCRMGRRACASGLLDCMPGVPGTESCNGLDDDCDGSVDEGIDRSSDRLNCGTCGNVCATGSTCCAGACVDLVSSAAHCGVCTMACGSGIDCCASDCVDLDTSPMNCGVCGMTCATGQTCRAGACCTMCGMMCVVLTTTANCGRCGFMCHPGEICGASGCCHADGTHCRDH